MTIDPGSPRLATPDQEALELRAVRLLARPDLAPVLAELKDYWRSKVNPSDEQQRLLDFEFEQTALCGMLNALNQDPKHPLIHAFGRWPHDTAGVPIPGTKHGHPNPDYVYWFAPVDVDGRYILSGHTDGRPPIAAEISLLDRNQVYQGNLSIHQLAMDADAGFRVTLDAEPANGRENHLQSKPGAFQLLIRNVVSDFKAELPMRLSLARLESGPAEPEPDDVVAARAEFHIRKLIDDLMFVNEKMVFTRPTNMFEKPTIHEGGVYSVSQAYAPGHFRLTEDEALVFHLTLGRADYAVVPVTNIWGGLGHYLGHIGSLGTGRAEPNPDGSFTIVLSPSDPGIHNWVDPAGLHEGVVFVRWVGFRPAKKEAGPPTLDVKLAKLSELPSLLPEGTRFVDAAERRRQLERHAADYRAATG